VKKLKMPDLDNKCFDSIVNPNDGRIYYMSPYANAFTTRNRTVLHAQQVNNENDPALKPLNANEEYSLLKNKHPWTLVVKGYRGITINQSGSASPSFAEKLWGGNKANDVLGATAATAHNLAEVLRSPKIGFEAYVLHTRNASFVTVGGFDSPT